MPSATLTWTLTIVAVVVTQSVGGVGLDSLQLPAWIVAIMAAATLGARFVLYVREIASDGPRRSRNGGADEREVLVLVRQGHAIQERHLEELQLLRSDLRESLNAYQEMVRYIRQRDKENEPAMAKIHKLHDAYFEEDEG